MLKVYSKKYYVAIDGGDWFEVDEGWSCPYTLRDDNEPTTRTIISNMTLDECWEYLQDHSLSGIRWDRSIFTNKKRIQVMRGWSYDDWETYKNFKTISYKCVFTECPNVTFTLAEIFKRFPADQCIQYMKERGMTACPMNF